jgi:SAM-dependent methyltransferase
MRLPSWYVPLLRDLLGEEALRSGGLNTAAASARRLSDNFNRADDAATHPAYMRREAERRAYFLYFTTTNLLKLVHPLDEIAHGGWFSRHTPCSVLELGCGTATGILGLAAWRDFRDASALFSYTGTDRDREAIAFTESAYSSLDAARRAGFASARFLHFDAERPVETKGSFDLILAMNLLNEIGFAAARKLLPWLAAHLEREGMAVLIEPALRETSRSLLALRDEALRDGWTVYSPCFHKGVCPALERETDWCHHEMAWERPDFIRAIDERIGNLKKSLKFSYLVLNRDGDTLEAHLEGAGIQRVVSELFVEKGRTRAFLCGAAGRGQFLKNKRDSTAANAAFDELERYNVVSVEGACRRERDTLVTKDTLIRKIS